MKNQKQLETILYSSVGVVILLVIAIAVNLIFSRFSARVDLTADRIYTLSEGTKSILSRLDTPVQIRLYFSQSAPDLDPSLRTYAQRVEDLLNEYRVASRGKIEIKKLDPKPDSDSEDSANLDGVEGQMMGLGGDKIYFGLAISCLDAKVALPVIAPQRERLLEYDISRAITQVVKPTKPTLGIMSGLPVFGAMDPMAMMRGGGGRQEPWIFINELKADFNVREIQATADKIDDDINLLVVVYPKAITDATQYAIDQFVLRGGKLVAFLDPMSVVDSRSNPMNPLQAATGSGASMDKLLKAWGLEFDMQKVVSDKRFATELQGPNGRPQANPSFLSLNQLAMDTNDVATTQLGRLILPLSGHFTGTPAEGLKQTVLFHSSGESQLTDKMMAQFGASDEFKASGTEYKLAIRLNGKFKTAFPDGKPGAAKDADKDKEKDAKADAGHLKESKEDGAVVLLGDADMLYDQFFAQVRDLFGQRVMMPFAANLTFLQNLLEQMAGDKDLIGIRSRATMTRPFTRVREMQAKAELSYESKIKQLEKDLSDAQQKINDLQRSKAGQGESQALISDEQKQEILRFQKKRAEVNRDLKNVRKNLRRDVDSLETSAKWLNILAMPFAVSLAGVVIAVFKRKRTAAK